MVPSRRRPAPDVSDIAAVQAALARRRRRRLAAVRLPRPEPASRATSPAVAPPGRTPRDAALVLPDSRHGRAARPRPRDREKFARASAWHDRSATPAAISSKPACASCSPACRRVAMEYSPRLRDSVRRARRRRHHRARAAGRASMWCRRAISSSGSPRCGMTDAIATHREASRQALPREGPARSTRSRGACAMASRPPSTTSSSSWPAGSATRGSSATPIRTSRRRRTPATRTICRPRRRTGRFGADEIVLLDLWGKLDRPGAVFADITWMGYTGREVPDRFADGVRARSAARATRRSTLVQQAVRGGRELRGWEVDRAASSVLHDARLRRSHPAPHRPQPRRIGPRQRRQHGRLRNARRSAAARRAPASRSSRACISTTSAFGTEINMIVAAARRDASPGRCRPRSYARMQVVYGGRSDVHPQDHAVLRAADRGRLAGRRHGARVAARSHARLVGADHRGAGDEQRADHRRRSTPQTFRNIAKAVDADRSSTSRPR